MTDAFFIKKTPKTLADSKKVTTFAPVKQKGHGSVAQLNRASDYGSEGYRFESCRNHYLNLTTKIGEWLRSSTE